MHTVEGDISTLRE